MAADTTRNHLLGIIALFSFEKVGCLTLKLAKNWTRETLQTTEWQVLKKRQNSLCPAKKCWVLVI
jgi:hypothetical protein